MNTNQRRTASGANAVISRRKLLKTFSGLGLTTAVYLAGCTSAATPAPTQAPASTTAPATEAPAATAAPTTEATAAATTAPTQSSGGTIAVYSALNESTNNAFIAAFKAATPGYDVTVLPLAAAGELQTRIQTEKGSPKGDIFIGGSNEFHDPLGKAGLLEAYKSPNADSVDTAYKSPNGFWTGWYIGIFGVVVNTDRFAKEMAGTKMPATWDDLLAPAWKGKLIYPDPVKTGGGYIFIATQIFRFNKDEAKAMAYMKSLHGNIAQYVGTSPQGIQLVGQGQFVACPNWSHDILTAKGQGQPVDLAVPEMTGFEIGAVSIIKGGPNTEAAKKFVDWVLTKEAGELNVKLSNRLSVRTDVAPAPGAPTLDKVKLVDYDRAWASSNKERVLKLWQTTVGV